MLKALLKDSAFYGGILVLGKIVSLISIPIITNKLTIQEFNTIDSSLVFLNFIVPFVFLGFDSAIGRFYIEYNNESKKTLISTAFWVGLIASLIITLGLWLFKDFLEQVYFNRKTATNYIVFIIISIPFIFLISFCANIFKFSFKKFDYALVVFLNPICFLVSLIYFSKTSGFNLEKYLVLNLCFNIFFALYAVIKLRKQIEFNIKKTQFKALYNYGLPFALVSVFGMAFSFIERLFLNNFYLPEYAGQYAFSYRIVGVIFMFNRAFQLSWGPISMKYYKEESSKKKFNKLLNIASISMATIIFLIFIFYDYIIMLLANENYLGSSMFIAFLMVANSFLMLSSITNIGINITKKTYLHLKNYGYSLGCFVSSFFILKSLMPNNALPLSILLGYCTLFITQTVTANKVYSSIQFSWKKPIVLMVVLLLTIQLIKSVK